MSNDVIKRAPLRGPLTVSDLGSSKHQHEDTLTATLKQQVTYVTEYPGAQASNSRSGNLFSNDQFGFEKKIYTNKVTLAYFMNVPEVLQMEDGSTKPMTKRLLTSTIKKAIKALGEDKVRLYVWRSLQPITVEGHEWAIKEKGLTLEQVAFRQLVRHPETKKPILYKDKYFQFREVYYTDQGLEDVDERDLTEPFDSAVFKAMVEAEQAMVEA